VAATTREDWDDCSSVQQRTNSRDGSPANSNRGLIENALDSVSSSNEAPCAETHTFKVNEAAAQIVTTGDADAGAGTGIDMKEPAAKTPSKKDFQDTPTSLVEKWSPNSGQCTQWCSPEKRRAALALRMAVERSYAPSPHAGACVSVQPRVLDSQSSESHNASQNLTEADPEQDRLLEEWGSAMGAIREAVRAEHQWSPSTKSAQ